MDQKHGDRHAQKKICTRIEAQNANLSLRRRGFGRLFGDGFIVNLLNPKTALFFLAFLPQFVEASRGHLAMQIAFLGVLFTFLGLITDGCYARLRPAGGRWLRQSRRYLRAERYVCGALLIGLGLTAAVAGNQKK